MKIVLINHTFQQEQFCKRWRELAKHHKDWDVTLLAPAKWTWGGSKTLTFGFVEEKAGFEFDEDNYHVRTINVKTTKHFGWTSNEMISYIEENRPDVIYHIGSHIQESLQQILHFKCKKAPFLKVYAFSMRGPNSDLSAIEELRRQDKSLIKKLLRYGQYYYQKRKVDKVNKHCDAIFCHYPDGMNSFIKEGFIKPIFMQTQVGVDTAVFYPDAQKRLEIRHRYGIKDDEFVFASAARFQPAKGALQVLDAFPVEGKWRFLLMGSGNPDEIELIRQKIKERNLEEKIILTGFIQWEDMAAHWNAADCAVHFTQTTAKWIETFSLALVQAMATGLPVIGSTSGSVPYQIGPDGIIVNEKDIDELHKKLQWAVNHQEEMKAIGEKLYRRTVNSFSTAHLNDLFYETVSKLQAGNYDKSLIDMADPRFWNEMEG